MDRHIRLIDSTCRDGMHAMAHQFTAAQVAAIAEGIEKSGIDTLEVSHGDGLSGSSIIYGIEASTDEARLTAANSKLHKTKLAVLILPGIGTKQDIEMAVRCGAKVVRVATHVTEADIAEQHIGLVKELGKEAIGLLMMVHMVSSNKIVEQAKLMQSYGADSIFLMDSAGALLPEEVKEKVGSVVDQINIPIGFHAHNNLSMAIANTMVAVEAGATIVDGTLRGLGAGAGNAQIEVLAALLQKKNFKTGVDIYQLMDIAEQVLQPMMQRPQVIDNASLMLGYAGVYSSFLLHTYNVAKRFGVSYRDVLLEIGKRKMVGGQEDMITTVAIELSENKPLHNRNFVLQN